MGDWLARIRFPDGRELYATRSSSTATVLDDLRESYTPAGERDEGGFIRDRNFLRCDTPLLPHFPERPLSEPDDLIVVRITDESCGLSWAALFCPRRNELVGPDYSHFDDAVQQNFDLLAQNDQLHLASGKSAETLCGQPATGEDLPFRFFSGFNVTWPDPPPPERKLFDEWNVGEVCRRCLLNSLLTRKEWG